MSEYYTPIKPDPPTCPHNDGVTCDPEGRNCPRCGWDPAVAKARLERICKKLGVQVPKPQEPKKTESES